MARTEQSLRITDAYRARLLELQRRASAATTDGWTHVDIANLDATHSAWLQRATAMLAVLQTAGVRLTAAYFTAFLSSELQRAAAPAPLDAAHYVGLSRTGKPLAEALGPTTLFTIKQAIRDGRPPEDASRAGLHQAVRLTVSEAPAPARTALADTILTDPHVVGWRRVTSGGCGACLAAATVSYGDHEPFQIHDNCQCSAEPIISDVPDHAPRPDGHDIFNGWSVAEQNARLGHEKAQLVRSGRVSLHDLLAVSPMAAMPDQITEAPLEALQAQTA